jgi:hypothetical protein
MKEILRAGAQLIDDLNPTTQDSPNAFGIKDSKNSKDECSPIASRRCRRKRLRGNFGNAFKVAIIAAVLILWLLHTLTSPFKKVFFLLVLLHGNG